ncbi:MAG: hypothetical protein GX889_08920 [Clostridiales bacterium]|nr:hypothetical protein [Clostridiales bacterium]
MEKKHFKIEIDIVDYLENFNRNNFDVEFIEIELYNENINRKIILKNRQTSIFFKSLENPISFYLFILNNSNDEEERIDILLKKGYVISNICIEISYERDIVENYNINEKSFEQIDLIKFLEKSIVDISSSRTIKFRNINQDLRISLLPIDDNNEKVFRKQVYKDNSYINGIEFNENSLSIKNDSILSSFPKTELLLNCKDSIIAPKDLDYLNFKIGENLYISFSNEEIKSNKFLLTKNGDLHITYQSPFFKTSNIKGLKLGYLFKIKEKIYFKNEISYQI